MEESSGTTDPVRAYLEHHGYADYIVEGGIDYLLSSWEDLVASCKEEEPLDLQQYLTGLDRRRILEEALALIPLYQQAWYHRRVYDADNGLRSLLVPVEAPLCGFAVASERGYTAEREWWYFHRPRHVDEVWPELV